MCTTYVVYYTTFVGQSYHICGILYHKRGILYHKREFPGNPYTDKGGEMDSDAFGNVLEPSDEIYKFNAESEVWELAG